MTIFNIQSGLLVSDCCHLQNFKILDSFKMGNKYMYFKGQNYRKGYTEKSCFCPLPSISQGPNRRQVAHSNEDNLLKVDLQRD